MNLVRRCRPSLAATTLLTALLLGACSYSPERSLTVSDTAKPAGDKQVAAQAKAQSRTKPRGNEGKSQVVRSEAVKSEAVKVADARRRVVADGTPKQPASSGHAPRRQVVASNSERECLVRAMYFESHRSSREGLLAVGTVVLNRVNSPSFPSTICGVVGQKRQFAPGVLSRPMSPRERHHADAVADEVLAGKRHMGIGDSMFFHVATRRYKYPNMRYLHVAGGNIFYRKVGRNAPRVTDGAVLAYAGTAPAAPEAPVTVASAAVDAPTVDKPAVDKPVADATAVTTTVAAAERPAAPVRTANRTTTGKAAPAPLPPPRTVLALPPREAMDAQAEIAAALPAPQTQVQVQSPATAQLAPGPASGSVSYTLPLAGTLSSTRPDSTEPSTLLSYRTFSAPARID